MGLLLAIILMAVSYYIGLSMLFVKAGEKGWKAFIPFYNSITHLKIIGKKWYWVFVLVIPGINILYFLFGMLQELFRSFGKESFLQQAAGSLFFFIYVPYLGFSKETHYAGAASGIPKNKKTQAREWADSLFFAVVSASIIHWSLMQPFKIPTPSMEGSLLMGDYLFVSKLHYGARTPQTLLQAPLTHQTWWWSDKSKSYSELIRLPLYRFPGFSEIRNNDVVVFNWPADPAHRPVDLKTNYVKRCLAIAGDTFLISKRKVYVNGKPVSDPPQAQFTYKVFTNEVISRRILKKFDIPNYGDYKKDMIPLDNNGTLGYVMDMSPEKAEELKKTGYADSIVIIGKDDHGQRQSLFPGAALSENWTVDDYGPLWIPKKGARISLTPANIEVYGKTIVLYEGLKNVEIREGKLFADKEELTEYTFRNNYYFMIGDNRHNSLDSRFWGFVPENHVVGKALFIWFSSDPDPKAGFTEAIRWERIFDLIK